MGASDEAWKTGEGWEDQVLGTDISVLSPYQGTSDRGVLLGFSSEG